MRGQYSMRNEMSHGRRIVGVTATLLAVSVLGLSACDHLKDEFLKPQNPGIVDQGAAGSPAAAAALKGGAMGRLKLIGGDPRPRAGFAYSSVWGGAGLTADECCNCDFQNSQNTIAKGT